MNYSNIKFGLDEHKLTISYNSKADKGLRIQSLFVLKSKINIDANLTISLKNNGQETVFDNVR